MSKKNKKCPAIVEIYQFNEREKYKICRYSKAYNECLKDQDSNLVCNL